MSPPPNNRARDEFDLSILREIKRGVRQSDLAQRIGIGRSQIAAMLRRVQRDDLALSGEPEAEVLRGYRP